MSRPHPVVTPHKCEWCIVEAEVWLEMGEVGLAVRCFSPGMDSHRLQGHVRNFLLGIQHTILEHTAAGD
jgi:hypothetical protein